MRQQVLIDKMRAEFPVRFRTEEWGSVRGQGRRPCGIVPGGMRDITLQGKKAYPSRAVQFGLDGPDADDVEMLDTNEFYFYWRRRTEGASHADAYDEAVAFDGHWADPPKQEVNDA